MFRRNKEKCQNRQSDFGIEADCAAEGFDEEDQELESRVKQWLKESTPPSAASLSKATVLTNLETQDFCEDMKFQDQKSQDMLFHPDFVEWTSIEMDERYLTSENDRPKDLLDALDEAKTALSMLLKAPFR